MNVQFGPKFLPKYCKKKFLNIQWVLYSFQLEYDTKTIGFAIITQLNYYTYVFWRHNMQMWQNYNLSSTVQISEKFSPRF